MAAELSFQALRRFQFSLYRLYLEAVERIELARFNKGITLRGAFGTVFRSLVCHDLKADCLDCQLHARCPYGFIFTPTGPADGERLRLNRDIPRPFVIKPPLDNTGVYRPGDTLCFDLAVVGRAQDFLPYFIVTFEELGRRGVGVRRGRYAMEKLEALAGDGEWEAVFTGEDRMVRPPGRPLRADQLAGERDQGAGELTLEFVTPVLLKEGGHWAKPSFGTLVKRLRDRVSALSYFYCGEPLDVDFKALGKTAEVIRTVEENLQWVEERRYARHRKLNHLLKGYIGRVSFKGEIGPFMPLLRLGEYVHVGKATAFGQGWYQIKTDSPRGARGALR